MAPLHYKTRGMTNPKGKPRVYFCCHPEDFARCFDAISDEVLDKQNCAIWYTLPGEGKEAASLSDLEQMQLFIVPVTTALLYLDSGITEKEIRFALEHHIPVLPLMQEPGLEERFNQVYGDLQFLDKGNNDPTAVSYEDKLEKYLESVLIGDDLANKIRAAFDAYVFLSYRKKDRKYAQELMRLIHKNDFCRDIAIWYDEFLTPGENFNDSIRDALQKSGLFVLTVTPSLLETVVDGQGNECDNYIVRHEYPMAKKERKPILPVELVATDKAGLAAKYEDIPICADGHNAVGLSDALLEAVKKMAIRENDTSPEHNFFIGLAYLGGVDVEVDHNRAVNLITGAAEAGCVEAMEKLALMYSIADGVKFDYGETIRWQRNVVTYYEKQLDCVGESCDAKSIRECIINALFKLGRFAYDGRKEDVYTDAFRTAISKLEELSDLYGEDHRSDIATAYFNLGNYYAEDIVKGRYHLAESYLKSALNIRLTLMQEDESYCYSVATVYTRLAVSYKWAHRYEEAEALLLKAIQIFEKGTNYNFDTYGKKLADAFFDIAALYRRCGQYIKAEEAFQKSITLYRKTLNMGDLALALKTLADMQMDRKAYDKAQVILTEVLDLMKAKIRKLAIAYQNKPITDYVIEKIFKHPILNLSSVYETLGECANNIGCADLGLENTLAAVAFFSQMRDILPYTFTVELAKWYHTLGGAYFDKHDFANAKSAYEISIALYEQCIPENAVISLVRNDLAVLYSTFNMNVEAEQEHLEALRVRKHFYEITKSKLYAEWVGKSLYNLGRLFEDQKLLEKAEPYYNEALEYWKAAKNWYWMVKINTRLGDLHRQLCNWTKSEQAFMDAIHLCVTHAESNSKLYDILRADAHDGLSYLYKKQNDIEKMNGHRNKAMEIALRYPDDPICKNILKT